MSDIKVICCDIDGTLVRDDKSLSDENRYWIKKAVEEKGIIFLIVSGRIFSSINHYNNLIGIKGLTSCLNGTYLVDQDGTVLANHTYSYSLAKRIVSIQKALNLEMLCVSGNKWFTESHENQIYIKKRPIYMQDSLVMRPEDVIENYKLNKFLFRIPDQELLKETERRITSCLTDGEEVTFYPNLEFLEVMPGKITKGTAVDDVMAYFNLKKEQIMALGDDINDVEMLEKAGYGIAMGNSLDCAKSVAYDITDTNENDGVAKAIKKYIFGL